MNLNEVLAVLRERWLTVISCLVLGVLGAALATQLTPSQYSAQATMYVSAPGAVGSQDAFQASRLAKDHMQSYALLLTNERITSPVVQNLGLGISPAALAGRMTVSAVPDTVVLSVAVTDPSPDRAAQIANAVADEFVKLVQQLEARASGAQPAPAPQAGQPAPAAAPAAAQVAVQVLQPAQSSPTAVSPQPTLNLALGALIGLLIGLLGAFLRHAVDTSVRSSERLRAATVAPILGAIPNDRSARGRPLILDKGTGTPRAEAFRRLRTNLQFIDGSRPTTVLVVTSARAGEGTTTTVCNMAIAMADAGSRVLVIDAHLRAPAVAGMLSLDPGPGLAGVLEEGVPLEDALRTWERLDVGFDVLPGGPVPARPSELLASPRLTELLDAVRRTYDVVLIDTPALLAVTDAAEVAPLGDGVILVVRYGRTTHRQIEAATDALDAVSARLLGTVLTRVRRGRSSGRVAQPKPVRTAEPSAGPPAPDTAGRPTTTVAEKVAEMAARRSAEPDPEPDVRPTPWPRQRTGEAAVSPLPPPRS